MYTRLAKGSIEQRVAQAVLDAFATTTRKAKKKSITQTAAILALSRMKLTAGQQTSDTVRLGVRVASEALEAAHAEIERQFPRSPTASKSQA